MHKGEVQWSQISIFPQTNVVYRPFIFHTMTHVGYKLSGWKDRE